MNIQSSEISGNTAQGVCALTSEPTPTPLGRWDTLDLIKCVCCVQGVSRRVDELAQPLDSNLHPSHGGNGEIFR